MKSTKETKSVQTPLYALTKGSGKFGATNYQCIKCGKVAVNYSMTPPPGSFGRCPDTSSGNHIWQQC